MSFAGLVTKSKLRLRETKNIETSVGYSWVPVGSQLGSRVGSWSWVLVSREVASREVFRGRCPRGGGVRVGAFGSVPSWNRSLAGVGNRFSFLNKTKTICETQMFV